MLRWKPIILLLLLCHMVSAQFIDFMPAVPLVAITVVIFLAMGQMMAGALQNPRLQAWTKTELRELLGGVILIVIIYSAFVLSQNISIAVTGDMDYMEVAINIVESTLTDGSQGYDRAFSDLIRAAAKVRAGATYAPHLSIPLWVVVLTYSTNPYAGIVPILNSLGMGAQALTNAVFLYEGLLLLLKFAAVTVPSVLLPFAFCARLIPFTRKIGNTLIAISLAAVVLLPFSIILMGEINDNIIDYPQASISSRGIDGLDANPWSMIIAEPFCSSDVMRIMFGLTDIGFAYLVCLPLLLSGVGAAAYPACTNTVQYTIYPLISNIFYIAHAIILGIWIVWAEIVEQGAGLGLGGLWAERVFETIYPFLTEVNNLVLLAYIEFILIATITFTGAKSISTALGGEWYMAGLQRMI